jgi:hypothetical protein
MKEKREMLEKQLISLLPEILLDKKKRDFFKEFMLKKDINPGFIQRILNDPNQILLITDVYLCVVTIGLYKAIKEMGNEDQRINPINPEDYFNSIELENANVKEAEELDFMAAAQLLESHADKKKKKLSSAFYDLLENNKEAFILATTEEMASPRTGRGRDSAANILRILKATIKNTQKLTEDQELYLKKVLAQLEEGGLPKQTAKNTLKCLDTLKGELINPFKVLAVLQTHIPEKLLESHYAEKNPTVSGKREVILSLYLAGE